MDGVWYSYLIFDNYQYHGNIIYIDRAAIFKTDIIEWVNFTIHRAANPIVSLS